MLDRLLILKFQTHVSMQIILRSVENIYCVGLFPFPPPHLPSLPKKKECWILHSSHHLIILCLLCLSYCVCCLAEPHNVELTRKSHQGAPSRYWWTSQSNYLRHLTQPPGKLTRRWVQKVGHCGKLTRRWVQKVGHCGKFTGRWVQKVGHCGKLTRWWVQKLGHCGNFTRRWVQKVGCCGKLNKRWVHKVGHCEKLTRMWVKSVIVKNLPEGESRKSVIVENLR